MNSDGGSDMAANAWPGFVDILSAVVIMFVFFVLITAAVLYFYTITYKDKYEGQAAVIAEIETANEISESEKVEELLRENQELREQIDSAQATASQGSGASDAETTDRIEATESFGEQANEQSLVSSDEDRSLVLFHDPGAITVDESSQGKIVDFIDRMSRLHGAENLEIVLTSPKRANASTQNQAKRLAVARMLNVRNALLESTVDRGNMQLTVVESEDIEESANWTRMQINILK